MRICIDAHLARRKIDGIGRYLIGLITGLGEVDRTNEYLLILSDDIAADHPLRLFECDNFAKEYVGYNLPKPYQQYTVGRKIVNRFRPDVYHHPHFDLPFGIHAPSVVTIHDLKFIHDHTLFKKWTRTKSFYMKHMMRSSVVRAARVVAISEFSKKDIMERLRVRGGNISIIHHGIDHLPPLAANAADGPTGHEPYFLFIGEKKTHKNIVRMIEAFHRFTAIDVNRHHKLLLVGNTYPRYQDAFVRKVRQLNLEDRVLFIDYASDADIVRYYRHCTGFLFPSLYEGFGFPVLEAMHYGKPVIISDITALPEIAGNAALRVDPFDTASIAAAMDAFANDAALTNGLVAKGYERVKRFTWRKCAEETLAVYAEAASLAGGKRTE